MNIETENPALTAHLTRLLQEYSRVELETINEQTKIDEFALDSLDMAELVMDLEKCLRCSITMKNFASDVQNLTIAQFSDFLNGQIVIKIKPPIAFFGIQSEIKDLSVDDIAQIVKDSYLKVDSEKISLDESKLSPKKS